MRKKARRANILLWVVGLMIFLPGCGMNMMGPGGAGRDGAPIGFLDHFVRARHKEWLKRNNEEIEELRELAGRNEWKLLVAGQNSVKVLDLSKGRCEEVYRTKNRLRHASLQRGGEIALLERKARGEENFVVVLKEGEELLRLRLLEKPERGSFLGGKPVLVTGDYVIFPDGSDVVAYRMADETRRVVHRGGKGTYLLTVREAGGKIHLVMVNRRRDPGKSEMVVLDADGDHRKVARLSGVTNVMVAGERVIVDRNGYVAEYRPGTVGTVVLAEGTILAAVDEDTILFTSSRWGINKLGWLSLKFSLNRYEFTEGESSEIASEFSIDTCYGVTYPLMCPDSEFVLVADNTESALLDREYLVYDIESGEEVGAFDEPFAGEHYFDHVIGWLN